MCSSAFVMDSCEVLDKKMTDVETLKKMQCSVEHGKKATQKLLKKKKRNELNVERGEHQVDG